VGPLGGHRDTVKPRRLILSVACTVLALGCAQVGSGNGNGGGGGGGSSATGTGGSSSGQGGTGNGGKGGSGGSKPATGTGGDFADDGGLQCGYQNFNLVPKEAEVLVVLDRSQSMLDDLQDQKPTGPTDPTKWSQVIPALVQVITMAGKDISWGLKTFPEDGSECAQATVTNNIDVQITAGDAQAVATAIMGVMALGNGTPTAAAVTIAANYLKMRQTNTQKFILLATDGQPSCAGTAGSLSADSNGNSRTDAVSAVTAAAQAGVNTFVVGVATKKNDDATLNNLANAGLEARNDPNPLATKYYLAATQAELVTALNSIIGVVSTCLFNLTTKPPDPQKVAFKLGSTRLPQDTTHMNGWDYTDANMSGIKVYGAACDMIQAAAANSVMIILGCPDLPPPT